MHVIVPYEGLIWFKFECVCIQGLYMDAVQLFPDRVQEFLDLMTEKELRLRAPMEEVDILLED